MNVLMCSEAVCKFSLGFFCRNLLVIRSLSEIFPIPCQTPLVRSSNMSAQSSTTNQTSLVGVSHRGGAVGEKLRRGREAVPSEISDSTVRGGQFWLTRP